MIQNKRPLKRPLFLGVHLNEAEKSALHFLAEQEGLANASYLRRALLRDFQSSARSLPADMLAALKLQQGEGRS